MSANPLTTPHSWRRPAAVGAGTSPLLARVRGLVFDHDDVLFDDTVWRRWLVRLLSRFGVHVSYREFFAIWDRDFAASVHRGECSFCESFQAFLDHAGFSRGLIDEIEVACQSRRHESQTRGRPFPGTRTTLERLRRAGYRLGVLADSDVPAVRLSELLLRLGLGGLFESVVSSFDLRQTKPEPLGYHKVLALLNLTADAVAFVGHDCHELAGAQAVGMTTIAFNADANIFADVRLGRFDQLVELLPEQCPSAAAMHGAA